MMRDFITEGSLEKLFARKHLEKHFPKVRRQLKECVYLDLKAQESEHVAQGASVIGGWPDMPLDVEWFHSKDGVPLSFLAQINLRDLAAANPPCPLASNGLLSFFYDTENCPWGFEPGDESRHRVYFFDGDVATFERRYHPGDEVEKRASVYETTTIRFVKGLSVPADYDLIPDEEDGLVYMEEIASPDTRINKLFGHPNQIQDDMALQCELVTNGIDCGDESALERPDIHVFRHRAEDWTLLLQLDSNEENDMRWGDGGRLFFWIRKQDLAEMRFDRTCAILQSY
jgi:uncharacterized protein YwqG